MVYTSGAAKNRLGRHRFGSLFDVDRLAQAAARRKQPDGHCANAKTTRLIRRKKTGCHRFVLLLSHPTTPAILRPKEF
jgi:hypothetical protein